MYYRISYILAFKSTCDIRVHCTNGEVSWAKANSKVIQKSI